MANVAKTIVATGCSSGLGFEAAKQLLSRPQPYRLILGARNVDSTQSAFAEAENQNAQGELSILPLQLSQLKSVKSFARDALDKLGSAKLDCLLLNAATSAGTDKSGSNASGWSEAYITNVLSQHYLVHLLREKLISSQARIVFVSSGAIRQVTDTSTLFDDMKANSNLESMKMYPRSKFVQLLNAHWWCRELQGQCKVVAVSPGLIPGTGLGRGSGMDIPANLPDAKIVPEGGANVLRAVDIQEFPSHPEQIFLTSWGEWWPKDVYSLSLDQKLQDAFSPSVEDIEKAEAC